MKKKKLQISLRIQDFLILGVLCFVGLSFAFNTGDWIPGLAYEVSDPGFEIRDGVLYRENSRFSGWQQDHFPDGSVHSRSHYFKGLKDGDSEEYTLTGSLRARYHFSHGKKDGLQEGWFIEGPKLFEARYRSGLLQGLQTEWHLNGNVFRQQQFQEGHEMTRKILYPSSEIFSNLVIKEGRSYGLDGGALCFEPKKEGSL